MDINEYISSGKLELYVYGALPEAESEEITRSLREVPEIRAEVEEIEAALVSLSAGAAPYDPAHLLSSIKQKIAQRDHSGVIPIRSNRWVYISWAASLALLVGLFLLYNENRELQRTVQALELENAQMETQIAGAREDAQKTSELLEVFRNRNIIKVPLQGQQIAPEAYAAVYWNRDGDVAYIDAKDLPEPPQGMVYQVWSLKLEPLEAQSIGLLEDFSQDGNKIFSLANSNSSEGFGITLEPEGGSETPTLERLYTLGAVSS